jgi:hypothetical protein
MLYSVSITDAAAAAAAADGKNKYSQEYSFLTIAKNTAASYIPPDSPRSVLCYV